MTPKEKAKELVSKFLPHTDIAGDSCTANEAKLLNLSQAKCVAILLIDEAIMICPYVSKKGADTVEQIRASNVQFVDYWLKVKSEIQNVVV